MDRLLSMQVFKRVIDEGSFAAAARVLDMSPPVVTRLVRDLEEYLGARLVQRTTRRLSLTEAGESYLIRVRNILQEIEDADANANAHTRELSGKLRIHSPPVLATYVVAPLVSGFRKIYPNITIQLEVGTQNEPTVEDYDITLLGTNEGLGADVVVRKIAVREIAMT